MLVIIACNQATTKSDLPKYLPPAPSLEKGLVNKYYSHFKSDDKMDIYTNIIYIKERLTGDNIIESTTYFADFKPSRMHKTRFESGQFFIEEISTYLNSGDTTSPEIVNPFLMSFSDIKEKTHIRQSLETYSYEQIFSQSAVLDTVIENRATKIIEDDRITYQHIVEGDKRDTFYITSKKYFSEGLGLTDHLRRGEDYTIHLELIEQMSMEEFEKRSKDIPKRVAYIDPETSIDKDNSLSLCGGIYDYYNGRPDGGPIGGKRAIEKLIDKNLKTELLKGQAGLLTLRFIINCKGEIGNFTTEESDHNYQAKTFSPELKEHLMDILFQVKEWQPCTINEEAVDSYAYVTFKIKDGQIYEILP